MIKEITPQIVGVVMLLILLVAPALTLPVSWLLLRRYRKAVTRGMAARAAGAADPPKRSAPSMPDPPALDPAAGPAPVWPSDLLYQHLVRDPWRYAVVYAAGGVGFALTMTLAFFIVYSLPFQPALLAFSVWMCSWPVVLTTNVVVARAGRTRAAVTLGYVAGLVALAALTPAQAVPGLSSLDVPAPSMVTPIGVVRIWVGLNLAPTILLLLFLNRRVRAVGPILLSFITVAAGGTILAWLGMAYGRVPEALVWLGAKLDMGRGGMLGILIGGLVLALGMFGALGWALLTGLRRAYRDKIINDQSLVLDAIWLVFGTFYSVFLVLGGLRWAISGAFAFVVYRLAIKLGYHVLARPRRRMGHPLLFLRVFSLGRRSERMFDAIARHWRYLDTVQSIVGPDLATTAVAPHEFLDYVAGRLPRLFISDRRSMEERVSMLDSRPDADGRFRVNMFFCREDTWPDVLTRLVRDRPVVLMDLRAFTPDNAGCLRELRELINVIPMQQCVFVVDGTTNESFLERTVEECWRHMEPDSPNHGASTAEFQPLRLTSLGEAERRHLLRRLCDAVGLASVRVA